VNASALPDLVSVVGTIAAIGPAVPERRGTTYKYLEIYEKGGHLRRLTFVHASAEIAALLEEYAIGIFLFWVLPGERRLWCVDRADGPKHVDFDAMRSYIMKET
jgi:hypothetical protein